MLLVYLQYYLGFNSEFQIFLAAIIQFLLVIFRIGVQHLIDNVASFSEFFVSLNSVFEFRLISELFWA